MSWVRDWFLTEFIVTTWFVSYMYLDIILWDVVYDSQYLFSSAYTT